MLERTGAHVRHSSGKWYVVKQKNGQRQGCTPRSECVLPSTGKDSSRWSWFPYTCRFFARSFPPNPAVHKLDRKSTRLNSSHSQISYAVFCLKKKKKKKNINQ